MNSVYRKKVIVGRKGFLLASPSLVSFEVCFLTSEANFKNNLLMRILSTHYPLQSNSIVSYTPLHACLPGLKTSPEITSEGDYAI
jgi:hypothetical protein